MTGTKPKRKVIPESRFFGVIAVITGYKANITLEPPEERIFIQVEPDGLSPKKGKGVLALKEVQGVLYLHKKSGTAEIFRLFKEALNFAFLRGFFYS